MFVEDGFCCLKASPFTCFEVVFLMFGFTMSIRLLLFQHTLLHLVTCLINPMCESVAFHRILKYLTFYIPFTPCFCEMKMFLGILITVLHDRISRYVYPIVILEEK